MLKRKIAATDSIYTQSQPLYDHMISYMGCRGVTFQKQVKRFGFLQCNSDTEEDMHAFTSLDSIPALATSQNLRLL